MSRRPVRGSDGPPFHELAQYQKPGDVPLSLRYDEAKRIGRACPSRTLPLFGRRFLVDQYIGIDVAKEALSVYDGKREFSCRNTRGCADLRDHLRQKDLKDLVVIFEATGPYSRYVREFCAHHSVRVWIVNPTKSASFTKTLGKKVEDRYDRCEDALRAPQGH
jgi:hypothetical protein